MLTPTADAGWTFSGWSGDLTGSDDPATVTVHGDMTVTATFQVQVARPVVDGAYSSGTGAANATSVSFTHTAGTDPTGCCWSASPGTAAPPTAPSPR